MPNNRIEQEIGDWFAGKMQQLRSFFAESAPQDDNPPFIMLAGAGRAA
jgi:hypothetical protein